MAVSLNRVMSYVLSDTYGILSIYLYIKYNEYFSIRQIKRQESLKKFFYIKYLEERHIFISTTNRSSYTKTLILLWNTSYAYRLIYYIGLIVLTVLIHYRYRKKVPLYPYYDNRLHERFDRYTRVFDPSSSDVLSTLIQNYTGYS
jgi:hypothetical protein